MTPESHGVIYSFGTSKSMESFNFFFDLKVIGVKFQHWLKQIIKYKKVQISIYQSLNKPIIYFKADIFHAFHTIKNHGIDEENIITMAFDDIAYNKQ